MRAAHWLFVSIVLFGAASPPPLAAAPPNAALKSPPKRRPIEPFVTLEWTDFLEECVPEKVCVEGQLYNAGARPATKVRLRIEIGGTKYVKPRTVLYSAVEYPTMEPGDRQQFSIAIDRKINYKHAGKEKVIEVGKYNFKIEPEWSGTSSRRKPGSRL